MIVITMKIQSISLFITFILISSALGGISNVVSLYSLSNPFRGVESISLPTDGEQIETNYLTNDDVFHNGNTYLRLHHLPDSPNWDVNKFWQYNHTAQTFTLDVIEADIGSRWRAISTTANGSLYYLGWSNLSVGTNYISLNGQGNDRQFAGFQTEGSFKFTKFSHAFAGYTPTNPNSFGYEEITVTAQSIPEAGSYPLILGFLSIIFVAVKRKFRVE